MRLPTCGSRGPATLLLAIAFLTWAPAAQAAPRVAALVPALKPPAAIELRDRFHDAVTRGIQAAGLEAVPAVDVRLRLSSTEDQLSCAGPGPCAARAATTLRAAAVVAIELTITGKDYGIRLKLLDGMGRELTHAQEQCEICTLREAEEGVARAATTLLTKSRGELEEAPARAAGVTRPEPKPAEPAPKPAVPAPAPKAAAPAPAPTGSPITAAPARDNARPPWRWLAVGGLGLGVVGLAVGIPLLAIDGNPTCNPGPGLDARKLCKEVYDTVAGGAVMTTIGLAGLAASGVFFYLDHRARTRPTAPRVGLVPLAGGGALTVSGRFD